MIEKLQGLVSELNTKLELGEINEDTYNVTFDFMNRTFDIVLDDIPTEMLQFMQGGCI